MTQQVADKLRDTMNKVLDMRNDLTQLYNTGDNGVMEHKEQQNLFRAITQIDIALGKMGKRLLKERMEL